MPEGTASTTTGSSADTTDLEAEVERLRAENERLKSSGGANAALMWRWVFSILLIVIASLSLASAISAYWLSGTLLDTDNYVETIAPLADDPAIQNAVADAVTQEVMQYIDIKGLVEQKLPEGLQPLAPALESSVEGFVRDRTLAIVQSDAFKTLWVEGNRKAHKLALTALTEEGDKTVSIDDKGAVSIDLAPLAEELSSGIGAKGDWLVAAVSKVGDDGSLSLVHVPGLAEARKYVDTLKVAGVTLPLLTLLFLGAAVVVAPDHRRSLMWAMVGFALATVSMRAGISASRDTLVTSTSAVVPAAVSGAVFDILTVNLVMMVRSIFALSVVVALGAALAGPSKGAVTIRSGIQGMLSRIATGQDFGTFGAWVHDHISILRMATLGIGLGVLVFWPHPTPGTVLWVTVGTVVLLLLLELFGRAPSSEGEDGAGA